VFAFQGDEGAREAGLVPVPSFKYFGKLVDHVDTLKSSKLGFSWFSSVFTDFIGVARLLSRSILEFHDLRK
jgi:hypothetical protein